MDNVERREGSKLPAAGRSSNSRVVAFGAGRLKDGFTARPQACGFISGFRGCAVMPHDQHDRSDGDGQSHNADAGASLAVMEGPRPV